MEKTLVTKSEKSARRKEKLEQRRLASAANAKLMRVLRKNTTKLNLITSISKVNVGCSGWFYWHWSDKFYKDVETKNWFKKYSNYFDTVELNAPFYSWPTANTIKTWLRQAKTNPDFVYTVKVSELITHVKKFQGTKLLINDFYHIATLLSPLMGCFLFQLPPSFHYNPAKLKNILSQLDKTQRNVIEFRHISWWNETVYNELRKHKIIFCSCSSPKLPDDLIKTANEIYIRFHGVTKMYRHNYSKKELHDWAKKIKAAKAKRIWAYFNNDNDGYAVQNAKTLIKMLKG